MSKESSEFKNVDIQKSAEPEAFEALFWRSQDKERENQILDQFTPEQQKIIKSRQRILSSLAYFIGKDFEIPIELGLPTPDCPSGWRQGQKADGTVFLQMNAHDLLDKQMDFLRFVTCHEGGHRRISRVENIPLEEWRENGFSFLMNAIEDPRDNNFVADNYPIFAEQMKTAYEPDFDLEEQAKVKAEDKLGFTPLFMQAGFEYIKQWYRQRQNQPVELTADLPPEVKEVVEKTLEIASRSWWLYPSKQEADESEDLIKRYADASYRLNRDLIWPEFKKLVEQDVKDQRTEEFLKESVSSLPQELKDKLTPEEAEMLEEAIQQAIKQALEEGEYKEKVEGDKEKTDEGDKGEGGQVDEIGEGKSEGQGGETEQKAIPLGSLSRELRNKIGEYIDSLPQEERDKLEEKAKKALGDFEEEIGEEIAGKLADDPQKKATREKEENGDDTGDQTLPTEVSREPSPEDLKREKDLQNLRGKLEKIFERDQGAYEQARREVMPIINRLTDELRDIFRERRKVKHEAGHKTGPKINITKRISEIAKGILSIESRAWEKREAPGEKDYAISLLVDLSGSMRGNKIAETFKAVIVLAEVLNKLSITSEILGFNDRIYEYKSFKERLSAEARSKMGSMSLEVGSDRALWNDDGWAVKEASARLVKRREMAKFLIVLSDGEPEPSPAHNKKDYNLNKVVQTIENGGEHKIIGLGIGPNTHHVARYYHHNIANVGLDEMANRLGRLLKEMIVDYDKF